MNYCRFVTVSLCCILFCSNVVAERAERVVGGPSGVVQAYRVPSDADIQWLLKDTAITIPNEVNSPEIVQARYISSGSITLVPLNSPRGLPNPPIPPAPSVANNQTITGLAQDGVVNVTATVANSSAAVMQMSSDRLPPPTEVPRESDIAPLMNFADGPVFLLGNGDFFSNFYDSNFYGCGDSFDNGDTPCVCITCILCGDHRMNRKHSRGAHHVPNMIGGSAWLTGYSVGTSAGTTGTSTMTLPTMLLTRPNVVEHFNANVQNRIWADYRSWNNAVQMNGGSRGVEQFSFGLEKQILRNASVEVRVPVLYQFASNSINASDTAVELGNVSVFKKLALLRNPRWTFSCGVGVSLPTANDWRPLPKARLKNRAYNLVSFIGVQWHPNIRTFGHFVVQHDVPIEKNELIYNSSSVKVNGQQVIRTGVQLGRWIYRTDHGKRPCRFGAFAEVNYAVVTEGSKRGSLLDGGTEMIYVSKFNSRRSTLTAAVGIPMVFGNLTCTNALMMPISGSNRPFSVSYSFSLSRQF